MSAAARVAHAAETIRARWEQRTVESPQVEAAQALEDAGLLMSPEAAARTGHLAATLVARTQDLMTAEARIGELEAERHSTNESLSEAAEQLRVDRDRIAELEAQRAALAERLRAGQQWQRGRNPELVSESYVSPSELRNIFGVKLTAPWDEPDYDPCHPCGCPKRFDRHADGCPAALRAEDVVDLTTLAPAQEANARHNPTFQTIELDLTATKEQWAAWQKALEVDLARTTNRGGLVTSHAKWRGVPVVVRCWFAEGGAE
ncbi:hypothetical protein F9278_15745 [Streptomyces phaeolivaceus]|uniref:Uncharacterized protein n=1 Tax=Streptomyces phaeolivaceus TaxID=2653200 RepID=A0A5P8K2Q9_9ACTN|nr:hypothetical protein [Streptomyces phaeolivaceus]QFQ97421.1 hypothetical protein F9278_15745 [Streptomyces phaeolivaceus]